MDDPYADGNELDKTAEVGNSRLDETLDIGAGSYIQQLHEVRINGEKLEHVRKERRTGKFLHEQRGASVHQRSLFHANGIDENSKALVSAV